MIGPDLFLTAGHCVDGADYVRFNYRGDGGSLPSSSAMPTYGVLEVVEHLYGAADCAILRLAADGTVIGVHSNLSGGGSDYEDQWPDARLIANLNPREDTGRVDVEEDGQIVWKAGTTTHPWVSLDGVAFLVGLCQIGIFR